MAKSFQLTLDGANIPASSADPALVQWLRVAGVASSVSRRLADVAAKRMQFMPADIKAAYQEQLTARRQHAESQLLARARERLRAQT